MVVRGLPEKALNPVTPSDPPEGFAALAKPFAEAAAKSVAAQKNGQPEAAPAPDKETSPTPIINDVSKGEPSSAQVSKAIGMWGGNHSYLFHVSMAELHGALGTGFSGPGYNSNWNLLYDAAAGRICRWRGYGGGALVWTSPDAGTFTWPGYWDQQRNSIVCVAQGNVDGYYRTVPIIYFNYLFGFSNGSVHPEIAGWGPWAWLVMNSYASRSARSMYEATNGRAFSQEYNAGTLGAMWNLRGELRSYNIFGFAATEGVPNLAAADVHWKSFWLHAMASHQCRKMGNLAGGVPVEFDNSTGAITTVCFPYWR